MGTFGLGGLHRRSTWLFPRGTFADLPPTAVDGSVAVVLDTNIAYQYDAGLPGWVPLATGSGGSGNSHWDPVRVATTGNIVLSGEQVIDGVLTSGDRVLVKDQAVAADNGIYITSAGAWTRAPDADEDAEVIAAKLVSVSEGTAHGDTLWQLTTNDPITVGVTGLAFGEIGGGTGSGGSNSHWDPVLVATTGNIALTGEQVIDGVLTSSSRVLVKDQTTASENGIYVSSAGAWTRATDADTDPEVIAAKLVTVSEGTASSDSIWQLTTNDPITVGVTGLAFARQDGGGVVVTGNSHWDPVRVATTSNITLSGEQTIDGVLTSGSRVLVKNQTIASQNGIYVSSAGPWTRSTDADQDAEVIAAKLVTVSEGAAHADSIWMLTTNDPITVGVTGLTFEERGGGGSNSHWDPVRVATTGNIVLSGEQVIDGVLTSGDRILVKDQAIASENGIYITDGGAWTRAFDADEDAEVLPAKLVTVSEGTANADSLWQLTTNAPITVGVTGLTFEQNQSGAGGTGSTSHWDPVRVATTGNVVLSGEQVIDGVLTSSDRVLVKDQAVGADNGIYVTSAGAWTRSTDADSDPEVTGAKLVTVNEGATNADSLWILTTNNPITVGATSLAFAEIVSAGSGGGGNNAHWNPARVATTGNIVLSGEQVIDGVLTSNDRVLVKNQTTASENGIYVTDAGAWTRAADADEDAEVVGAKMISVSEGTAHGDTLWQLTTNDPITVGVTGLTFAENQSGAGGGSGGGSTVTFGYRGTIPPVTTFQYLSCWGPTASSDVGFTPMAASTLIGCSVTVNKAHPTNTYTLEIMEDPTGRQGTGPLVLGSIVLAPTTRNNQRRNLSVPLSLGVELGVRIRRTGGAGNSNPIQSIIGALEYTTP